MVNSVGRRSPARGDRSTGSPRLPRPGGDIDVERGSRPAAPFAFPAEHRPDVLGFHLEAPPARPLDRAMAAARAACGPYGIVSRCRSFATAPGLPTLPVYVARGPRRGLGEHQHGFDIVGMGVSEDHEMAWLKAVAEAVERYCFALGHDPSTVLRASHDDVAGWAVPLSRFGLLSDRQYVSTPKVCRPAPDQPIDWTWAWSLDDQRFHLVPAALVYPSVGFQPPNNFTRWVMSTGLATHISTEAAILAGVYEVVERDALMIHWLHHRAPRRVVVEPGRTDAVAALVRTHFTLPDFEFVLLDMTPDSGIPTIACLALSDDPARPSLTMGAASRLDPSEAAAKALFETAQLLAGFHGLGWDSRTSIERADIRTLWDNAHFYAGAEGGDSARFMVSSPERVALHDLPNLATGTPAGDLATCVDRLRGVGLEVLATELTSADVARCGFRTTKVFAPGAVDIHGDARYPLLGSPRIRTMPAALGWPALDEDELNLAPCPMS